MPSITHPDLEAYFQRIGFTGDPLPTLAVLRDIQWRHALTIPWEDLNVLLRWPVLLDLAALTQKLVYDRRGGYCFEQNTLLKAVLEAIGFEVIGLQARVLWMLPEGALPARTHMALQVLVDGDAYLVDVGFGSVTQTGPLRLETDSVQSTPHEPFRLVPAGEEYIVQALLGGIWQPLYRLSLDPCYPSDYEIANYYVATHPRSRFHNLLHVTRPTPEGRHTLTGPVYTIHTLAGGTERRQAESVHELRGLLTDVFSIQLPETPELAPMLERVIAGEIS